MSPASRRVDALATWALVGFGLVLPLEGIGAWSPRDVLGMQPCDLVVVLASPLLVALVVRERARVALEPIVRALGVLALVAIATSLARGDRLWLDEAAKHGVMLLTVSSLAAAPRPRTVLVGVSAGGLGAVAVSLAGYGGIL